MSWLLHRPSFWPEPRDPWSWQRALTRLVEVEPLPDPWPCWERHLRRTLSRRSVAGLYGLRTRATSGEVIGLGLLARDEDGWRVGSAGRALLEESREQYPRSLAELLVRRSAWVRLALSGLSRGAWLLPRGVAAHGGARIRVGVDLTMPPSALSPLPRPSVLLGDLFEPGVEDLQTAAPIESLSALHAPLHLLHAHGWLDAHGFVRLPDALAATLHLESPAAMLRRITDEEADARGFAAFNRVARRLWTEIYGSQPNGELDGWADEVLGGAIERGSIEVSSWSPGQPRHGRGLRGDRDRKLVRWTVHDDFALSSSSTRSEGAR